MEEFRKQIEEKHRKDKEEWNYYNSKEGIEKGYHMSSEREEEIMERMFLLNTIKRLEKEEFDMKIKTQRLADAFIAIRDYNWDLIDTGRGKALIPPRDDERINWTAIWDEDGLPHWLPEYSKGEK